MLKGLYKDTFHRFQELVLGKTHSTNARRNCLDPGDVAIQHDFTEALQLIHNREVQSAHFGGSVTVSIEGYTVHYRKEMYAELVFDFHSFLSDEKTQMACTVHNHMTKLVKQLKQQGVLKEGGRLLGNTDGCAAQYKCATAVYFMSLLSFQENIVCDRGIGCAGHGKCEVDAINGVDKNTIYRRLWRDVPDAAAALDVNSSSLKVHAHSIVDGKHMKYSAAEDCKRVLEQDGGEGVKSVVKREKREKDRGINKRYWHLRAMEEKLSDARCHTIQIPEKGVNFSDMHHYYCCPQLGPGRAALRRVPCYCQACNSKLKLPWINGKDYYEQERFQFVDDCYFASILGDVNKWYIVDIKQSELKSTKDDFDEVHAVVLDHITSKIVADVKIGETGAIGVDANELCPLGYELVKFTSLPYTDQKSGKLMCDGYSYAQLPFSCQWYTITEILKSFEMIHVVQTGLNMMPHDGDTYKVPPRMRQYKAVALKLVEEEHHFILDENLRRSRLEYDPNRVFAIEDEFEKNEYLEHDNEGDSSSDEE